MRRRMLFAAPACLLMGAGVGWCAGIATKGGSDSVDPIVNDAGALVSGPQSLPEKRDHDLIPFGDPPEERADVGTGGDGEPVDTKAYGVSHVTPLSLDRHLPG